MTSKYSPILVKLTEDDLKKINDLSRQQTEIFGHDDGYFRLGRKESSHEIGFEGEIGLLRYFKEEYHFIEPRDIGLEPMGDEYDVHINIGITQKMIHVKTGRWTNWPQKDYAFGIHYWQKIEESNAPIVLVSILKNNPTVVRIEGFITSEFLGKCRVIRKGELFPGMNYPSRTDNWLTFYRDYSPISGLLPYLLNQDKTELND